uniref:Circumsporozoite protein n=1 Tax=Leptocylindrus danicus TaxID=163516 RepID=A0A7S2LRV9_9STRA|mmetsp:Transcript_9163/g.13711  ORF Transcript_9163/g.13711 Transcript_9163/m.13711 type:complete len:916 (+) Transcript_9163:242-2989(+)
MRSKAVRRCPGAATIQVLMWMLTLMPASFLVAAKKTTTKLLSNNNNAAFFKFDGRVSNQTQYTNECSEELLPDDDSDDPDITDSFISTKDYTNYLHNLRSSICIEYRLSCLYTEFNELNVDLQGLFANASFTASLADVEEYMYKSNELSSKQLIGIDTSVKNAVGIVRKFCSDLYELLMEFQYIVLVVDDAAIPTATPSVALSAIFSDNEPSVVPTLWPSITDDNDTVSPSVVTTVIPPSPGAATTLYPTTMPTTTPSTVAKLPSVTPSISPSKGNVEESIYPTVTPSTTPSATPSVTPSSSPSTSPMHNDEISSTPSTTPSSAPSVFYSNVPSSVVPTSIVINTSPPSELPTSIYVKPTYMPSIAATTTSFSPSKNPSAFPTVSPSMFPSLVEPTSTTSRPSLGPTILSPVTGSPIFAGTIQNTTFHYIIELNRDIAREDIRSGSNNSVLVDITGAIVSLLSDSDAVYSGARRVLLPRSEFSLVELLSIKVSHDDLFKKDCYETEEELSDRSYFVVISTIRAYCRAGVNGNDLVSTLMENSMSPISQSFEIATNNEDIASITYRGIGVYERTSVSNVTGNDDANGDNDNEISMWWSIGLIAAAVCLPSGLVMYAYVNKRRKDQQQSRQADHGNDCEIHDDEIGGGVAASTYIEEGKDGYSIYDCDDAPTPLNKPLDVIYDYGDDDDSFAPQYTSAAPSIDLSKNKEEATKPKNAVQEAIRKKHMLLMKNQVSQELNRISPADMNDIDALLELYVGREDELMEMLSSMGRRSESGRAFEKSTSSLYISSEEETSSAHSSEATSSSSGNGSVSVTFKGPVVVRDQSHRSVTSEGQNVCLAIDEAIDQGDWKDVEEKAAYLDRLSSSEIRKESSSRDGMSFSSSDTEKKRLLEGYLVGDNWGALIANFSFDAPSPKA